MSKETKKKLFSAKREEREASQERIGAMVPRTKTLEHDKDCGIMRWPRGSWAKEEGELHVNKAKPMWRMRAGGTAVMGNMVGASAHGVAAVGLAHGGTRRRATLTRRVRPGRQRGLGELLYGARQGIGARRHQEGCCMCGSRRKSKGKGNRSSKGSLDPNWIYSNPNTFLIFYF